MLVFFNIQAQNQYYFQFNLSIEYTPSCANETQDGETIDVSILNENNGLIADYSIDLVNLPLSYNNGNEVYSYASAITTLNERPYRIVADYTAYCEDTGGTANAFDYDLVFNHGDFHDYDIQDSNTGLGITTSIDATTSPVLITPHQAPICSQDLIFTDTEASEFVNGLTWYFFNINNQWEEIYNYSNYYPLKYSIEDIIGSDYLSVTGSNAIKLMYKYQFNSSSVELESEFIIVDITDCSPEIVGNPITTNTKCSYDLGDNDGDGYDDGGGSFTVTFNRPLDPDELLTTVNLYNDGPDGIINNADDILVSSLTDQSYIGTTYAWPNPLSADTYRLEYQSGGSGSLVEYFPIVINSPTAVTFNATWTDVDCFGEDTGSISIYDIGGGTGNYQYSINNGVNWTPIGTTSSHTVVNLFAGDYQVKIIDSNGCIAQQ